MTGLNYPDDLYADALAKGPLGAHQSQPKLSESERKLRTALAYVCHARDLIREALGDNEPSARSLTNDELARALDKLASTPERVPKWDPAWLNTPPNCDGLKARDIRAPHPMQAEAIRDHDERLSGAEDRL